MVVSHLFLYIELTPVVHVLRWISFCWDLVCVMCGMKSVSSAGFSLCCEQDLALFMCRLLSVLRAGFILSYERAVVCAMCGL